VTQVTLTAPRRSAVVEVPEDNPTVSSRIDRTEKLVLELAARTWLDRANCRGIDPQLFYPDRGEPTRQAKEVCTGCEVREACLDYALASGQKFGIWGGTSERERRALRSRRLRERRAAAASGD